jgi:hypothetical protein
VKNPKVLSIGPAQLGSVNGRDHGDFSKVSGGSRTTRRGGRCPLSKRHRKPLNQFASGVDKRSMTLQPLSADLRPRKIAMKYLLLIAAAAALMTGGVGATAAELPTYEASGFPITPHQVAIMGAADIEEQSASPPLTLGGMPASPHQVAVLTPRTMKIGQQAAAKPITVGISVR